MANLKHNDGYNYGFSPFYANHSRYERLVYL